MPFTNGQNFQDLASQKEKNQKMIKSSVESLTPLQDSVRAKILDRPKLFGDDDLSLNLTD
jgi:hypothetical protein